LNLPTIEKWSIAFSLIAFALLDNQIERLSLEVCDLKQLHCLDVENNPLITKIPEMILETKNAKQIHLSNIQQLVSS
jgi:Leucine-rich repeat (LRR) protein